MNRRITILAPVMPYPANEGGKADHWRRALALKERGAAVQLVSWTKGGVAAVPGQDLAFARSRLDSVVVQDATRSAKAISVLDFFRVPYHSMKFRLDPVRYGALLSEVRAFAPEAILLEGPWTSQTAFKLAADLEIPLLYRSHNIEHRYMDGQAKVAKSRFAGFKIWLSNRNLEALERSVMARADWIFDISCDDMEWWGAQGVQNTTWLPPICGAALESGTAAPATKDVDVLFLGNLTTPNNIQSVEWLIGKVWPLVLQAAPDAGLVVAGSSPGPLVQSLVASQPQVRLLPNVPDPFGLLSRAKVVVNPALSGSGIQLKTMDMLLADAHLVATPQGMAGFPRWLKDHVDPTEDPSVFAHRIVENLRRPFQTSEGRERARYLFGPEAVDCILERLDTQKARSRA